MCAMLAVMGTRGERCLRGTRARVRWCGAAPRPRRHGQGATVLVTGDAGIGKTRLVAEVASAAGAKGFEVLLGRSIDLVGVELPFQPFVDALRPLGNPFGERVAGVAVAGVRVRAGAAVGAGRDHPRAGRVGGSPLGRRLDARPRRLPGPQRRRRAGGARGDLSLGRAVVGGTRGPAAGWCAPFRRSARGRAGAAGRRRSASTARRPHRRISASGGARRDRRPCCGQPVLRRGAARSRRDRGKRCRVACGTCCCAASPSSTVHPRRASAGRDGRR